MTDAVNDSAPVRWTRRRWIAFGSCVASLLIAALLLVPRTSVVERARLIKVGQPQQEVTRLMGRAQTTYVAGPSFAFGERYNDMTSVELTLRVLISQFLGIKVLPHIDTYPVDVQYDANRNVQKIRIKDSGSDQYIER
jgi:hypothetical protein